MKKELNNMRNNSRKYLLMALLSSVAALPNAHAKGTTNANVAEDLNRSMLKSARDVSAPVNTDAKTQPQEERNPLGLATINSINPSTGTTLLMYSALKGDINQVQHLINQGADVNIKNNNNLTALRYALHANNLDIAKILVDNGADTSFLGEQEPAIRQALEERQVQIVAIAPTAKAAFPTPATTNNFTPIATATVDSQAVTPANNQTSAPIALAIQSDDTVSPTSGYKEMLQKDGKFKDYGDPVVNAAELGDLNTIKELVSQGYSVNSTGKFSTTPLMVASYYGHNDVVDYLIKNGAKVNSADDAGMTPLAFAHLGVKSEVAAMLLANGATPDEFEDKKPAAGPLFFAAGGLFGASGTTAAVVGGAAAAAGVGVAIGGSGGSGGGSSGGGGGDSGDHTGAISDLEKNSTGAGVTVAIIDNGVQKTGPFTDGSHATESGDGDGFNTVNYDFTVANSNGVVVWDSNSKSFTTSGGAADGTPENNSDKNGHGTENALIINQIASDSKILSIRTLDANGFLDLKATYEGIQYAATRGAKVVNNSWGYFGGSYLNMSVPDAALLAKQGLSIAGFINNDGDFIPYDTPLKITDSLKDAINNGAVLVWATGNDSQDNPNITAGLYLLDPNLDQNATGTSGTANPDIAKHWLNAGAVKDNGDGTYDIAATSSNKCGLTKERCLVAVATSTSHAAAEVSGAVAKLISSGLTPEQAASRILATAYYIDNSGKTVSSDGVTAATIESGNAAMSSEIASITDANGASNEIYGHGLLNRDLAFGTFGSLFVRTTSGAPGGALLGESSVKLGKAFGDALANSNVKFIAFDNAGNAVSDIGNASFSVDLTNLVSRDASRLNLDDAMQNLGNSHFENTTAFENGKVEFNNYATEKDPSEIISPENESSAMQGNFAYTNNFGATSQTISHNVKMDQLFGFGAITSPEESYTILDSTTKNPYLGFAEEGMNSVTESNLTKNISVKFGAFNGKENNIYDDYSSPGKDVSGTVGEITYSLNNSSIAMQGGSIVEEGAFLGSETDGIFATDGKTPTNFVGISGQTKFSNNLSIFGYYVMGASTPETGANTLFSDISTIRSSAYSLGISYDGIANDNSTIGFAISQPLHVDKATASFSYDAGTDANGQIERKTTELNLTPSGREMDLQSYYHLKMDNNTSQTISTIYRINPDNIATNPDEAILMYKIKNKF